MRDLMRSTAIASVPDFERDAAIARGDTSLRWESLERVTAMRIGATGIEGKIDGEWKTLTMRPALGQFL